MFTVCSILLVSRPMVGSIVVVRILAKGVIRNSTFCGVTLVRTRGRLSILSNLGICVTLGRVFLVMMICTVMR